MGEDNICPDAEEVKDASAQGEITPSDNPGMGRQSEDLEVAARVRGHLRQQMKEREINRTELARRLGINSGNLTRILHGQVTPSLGLVMRICRVLRLSPTRVLEENAPPEFADDKAPKPRRYVRKTPK